MDNVSHYFATNRDRFVSEWRKFLSFKSISADPAYAPDCIACAEWLSQHLAGIGLKSSVWGTDSLPLVFAERPGNPDKPTVLFYGHYDVQPVDPIELWESDPFEATLRNDRMYARGAQDNKGQLFFFCKALEALIATNADLPTIKLLIEGEEESGSSAMQKGLEAWREDLRADILMVCDTGMVKPGNPTITMGLRGIASCELRVSGPRIDLHSGVYGGVILNPLQVLARLVAGLHADDGSVAVPGFYDGTREPTELERGLVNAAPIDLSEIEKQLGVPLVGGEDRFLPLERRGLRPTLEINGVGGGYQGPGNKTVIPTHGIAKLSVRLVAGQDPKSVLSAIKRYVEKNAPAGARCEILDQKIGGCAFQLSTDSDIVRLAEQVSKDEFGVNLAYLWEGASIPIIPLLAEASGAKPLLVGFGLEEDSIHSPNESFSLGQFEEGYRFIVRYLVGL